MPNDRRLLVLAAVLSPLLALTACGGRVVGVGDTSGAGGSGGAPSAAAGGDEGVASAGSTSTGGRSSGGASATGGGPLAGGAPSTPECAPSETYCANWGRCLDLNTNPIACGSCTTPCAVGDLCNAGQCPVGQCDPGLTWCTSANGWTQCEDLQTSTADCGACAHACGIDESCVKGECVPPDCSGFTYCPDRGCVDTTSDLMACGACRETCSGPSMFSSDPYTCVSGKCSCAPGALPCAGGCATEFWYCPTGPTPALEVCKNGARTLKETCACRSCLSQVEDCATDLGCINSMDSALSQTCPGCGLFLSGDQNGKTSPLATSLVDCINTNCAGF